MVLKRLALKTATIVAISCTLMSCTKEDVKQLTLRPVSPTLEDRLDAVSHLQSRAVSHYLTTHDMSASQKQQSMAVLRLSQSCAKKRLIVSLDAHMSDEHFVVFKNRFFKAQRQCLKDIADRLVVFQAGRACPAEAEATPKNPSGVLSPRQKGR